MARKKNNKTAELEPVTEVVEVVHTNTLPGTGKMPETRLCSVCFSEFKGDKCPHCGSG